MTTPASTPTQTAPIPRIAASSSDLFEMTNAVVALDMEDVVGRLQEGEISGPHVAAVAELIALAPTNELVACCLAILADGGLPGDCPSEQESDSDSEASLDVIHELLLNVADLFPERLDDC